MKLVLQSVVRFRVSDDLDDGIIKRTRWLVSITKFCESRQMAVPTGVMPRGSAIECMRAVRA
jgi:hypothetical protein